MSYTPPYTITPKILDLVSHISETVGKLEVLAPTAISPTLRKTNRIKTITGTLEIEGNTLGIEKITAILEGKRVIGNIREIAEVKGAIKVYDNLNGFDYTNLDDLLTAHRMLMEEVLTKAGAFRTTDVGVGGEDGVVHIAPPHSKVPDLMRDLFNWIAESDAHPLIKSSVFHYEFEFIHPFIDGNGRMGRLWQSLILYDWKPIFSMIPAESVIKEMQQGYYNALEAAGNRGESTPFVEFMLESIWKSLQRFIEEYQKSDQKSDQKILALIAQDKSITIKELALKLQMSESGIKKALNKLKTEGYLKRTGSKKGGYWEISS